MTDLTWDAVRLPGVYRPSKKPPYLFTLKPAAPPANFQRAAFDGAVRLTKSSILRFRLHSPSSQAMFPDIVRGDFGFPTVCLINAMGTVYHFARGNLKDFFDISRPNEPQTIELPVAAFVYSRDLKSNVPDNGTFFDHPITGIFFDFLSHPNEEIDICLTGIEIGDAKLAPAFSVQDLVIFERAGQAKQLPAFATETDVMSFGMSLSNAGTALGCAGSELRLSVSRGGTETQTASLTLKTENSYVALKLPSPGAYRITAAITRGGQEIARSSWTVSRALPKIGKEPTILGISDEYEYDRTAAAGGSWDRIPVSLQSSVNDPVAGVRFATGTNPLPVTTPGQGRRRVVAAFAMPKWLSRRGDIGDYYRYRPSDWSEYRRLVTWLAEEMLAAGATHYEVWNEASAIGHWNDDMPSLVELHRVSYEAIKDVDSAITVIGGCTHSWTFDFLRRFLDAGGAQYCDGLAIHGYTYQPHQYIDQFDGIDTLIEEFASGRPEFKAFITELGFRYPAFSLDDQAKYLALYTLEAASRPTIGAVLWFRYTNPRPEILSGYRQNSSTGYALVGNAGSYCRPAFAAYRFVERLLQQFDEVRASGPSTARRYEFVKDGSVEAIGIYQPDGEAQFPAEWTKLDQYGGKLESRADFSFAVSPQAAHLLR
jgi:hypothetical protein